MCPMSTIFYHSFTYHARVQLLPLRLAHTTVSLLLCLKRTKCGLTLAPGIGDPIMPEWALLFLWEFLTLLARFLPVANEPWSRALCLSTLYFLCLTIFRYHARPKTSHCSILRIGASRCLHCFASHLRVYTLCYSAKILYDTLAQL